MSDSIFTINHSKSFPTLPNAPIVEAVLHWQTAATVPFNEVELADQLRTLFPAYQVDHEGFAIYQEQNLLCINEGRGN